MIFSDEQLAVLGSPHRITVVKACPGSGKTRVFVEALRRRVQEPLPRGSGVAALSFTNAAKDEIAERFGNAIASPHFVGTLDSFMLRFVVRPFGHLVGLSPNGVQLVPAVMIPHYDSPEVRYGDGNGETISIFELDPTSGDLDRPAFSFRHPINRQSKRLPPTYAREALRSKEAIWRRTGRISHADCHYLAAKILSDPNLGPFVVNILSRRFPVSLVDEFQDTGWFLGRALMRLLESPNVKALLVGDPDQSIYEFGGADSSLFGTASNLSGSHVYPLSETRRCPARVASVAAALSSSGARVTPIPENGSGRSILLIHRMEFNQSDSDLAGRIQYYHDSSQTLAILARKGKAVERLLGVAAPEVSGGSALARRVMAAVNFLAEGNPVQAAKKIGGVLGFFLDNDPGITKARLLELGVSPTTWRRAQYRILLEASKSVPGETWNDWLPRVKSAAKEALEELGHSVESRELSNRFKRSPKWNIPRHSPTREETEPDRASWPAGARLSTIHRVKGLEFDTVALVVPKPRAPHTPCPSKDWWPSNGAFEERRVAFVAASRAKKTFILCVHEETFTALQQNQSEFVGRFETIVGPDGDILYQEESTDTVSMDLAHT